MTDNKPLMDFEAAMNRLEDLVSQMEQGDLSLEDSLKAFEQGIQLTRECQHQLEDAEQKVSQLIEDNGGLQMAEFDPNENDTDA